MTAPGLRVQRLRRHPSFPPALREAAPKLDHVNGEEGRNQAKVGSSALELYASLPLPARRAFQELIAHEEQTGSSVLDEAIMDITRALLRARWKLTDELIIEEVRERGKLPEGDMSEEEIASLAVDMANRAEERQRS